MIAVSACVRRVGVDEDARHAGLDLARDVDVHPRRQLARVEHGGHDDVADACPLGRHRELAGLDARGVEDRVDEVEQLPPALLDDDDALALTVGQLPARHEVRRSRGSR